MNFLNNRVLNLPIGFRFHPTDEELVLLYLKPKVFALPLPANIIAEFDVCNSDPWDLPGEIEQEKYFFSKMEAKYPNGKKMNRATMSGYWKVIGNDKAIVTNAGCSNNHHNHPIVVGIKKTLVFYIGKAPHGSRTDWFMHEYRLVHTNQANITKPQVLKSPFTKNLVQKKGKESRDWVLCKIFLKKKHNETMKNDDEEEEVEEIDSGEEDNKITNPKLRISIFYDLNHHAPCSSSSGSSVITFETGGKDRYSGGDRTEMNGEESEECDEGSNSICNNLARSF